LAGRAIHYFGNITQWSPDNFDKVSFLLQGISESEIGNLPEEAFDAVSKITCWNKDQLKCLANRAAQILQAGKNLNSWTSATWAKVDTVATGFSADQLETLTLENIATAQSTLSKQKWNQQQLQVLADKLLAKTGNQTGLWNKNDVMKAGTLLSGLQNSNLVSIKATALKAAFKTAKETQDKANADSPMVNETAPLVEIMCTNEQYHSLTPEQLGNITEAGVILNETCPEETTRFTPAQTEAVMAAVVDGETASAASVLSGGAIAGIVIGVFLLVALIGVVIFAVKRNNATTDVETGKGSTQPTNMASNPTYDADTNSSGI